MENPQADRVQSLYSAWNIESLPSEEAVLFFLLVEKVSCSSQQDLVEWMVSGQDKNNKALRAAVYQCIVEGNPGTTLYAEKQAVDGARLAALLQAPAE